MSDKNPTLNQLGNAEIPADLLTPTMGSNYGLDGYPDMDYGIGVLDAVLDPELHEAPALPTGLTKASADGMDLHPLMGESLSNLDWLDPTQLQDPDRLPVNPHNTVIPELEEAWSVGLETDGSGVRDRDLEQARYEESLKQDGGTPKKATARQMAKVATHAMRRSAAGQDIDAIVKEALESMGEEMGRIAPVLRRVRAEHGLVGNVYIRAAAYPGFSSGKWSKSLRKTAARYILVSPEEMRQATWIQNGRCTYTGKFAVTQIPWKKALAHYKPRLESAGRKVGSGDPRSTLQAAFLALPEKKVKECWHPQHSERGREGFLVDHEVPDIEDPQVRLAQEKLVEARRKVERMEALGYISRHERDSILASGASPKEMLRTAAALYGLAKSSNFSGAPNQAHRMNRELYLERLRVRTARSLEAQEAFQTSAAKKAGATLRSMVAKGQISSSDLERLLSYRSAPHEMLRVAAYLAAAPPSSEYTGTPNRASEKTAHRMWARLARAAQKIAESKEALSEALLSRREARVDEGVAKVERAIKSGLTGGHLKALIHRTFEEGDVRLAVKKLAPTLKKTGALQPAESVSRPYRGHEIKAHALGSLSRLSSPKVKREIAAALRWVRRSMSEGFAGEALTDLIGRRFTASLLSEAQSPIDELRSAHEGGAGFLYVDTEAYASPTGVTGCEKGALRHRANQIPAVTEMPRCASCALARVLEDGTRKCGVYHKLLLKDSSGAEMKQLREANIRVANMGDEEQTASMFAPAYDPGEFSLRNSNLEDVEMDQVEFRGIDISFGGWDL